MPRIDNLTETKLLFCTYAKQAKLLVHNRQLLNLDNKVIITHFKLLQSLAIYLEKEPKFYKRIPKYAHHSNIFADNFGHYLELIKKEKELYIEERKNLNFFVLRLLLFLRMLEKKNALFYLGFVYKIHVSFLPLLLCIRKILYFQALTN